MENNLQETGFWSRFTSWLTGRQRLNKGESMPPDNAYLTAGGTAVNAETAMRLSAVWACVRLRSQTIATLPLHLRDRDKNIAYDHPLYRILHDAPNADMCASEFWEAMIATLDTYGNSYARIYRNVVGDVVALEVLNPDAITPRRAKDGSISYEYYESGIRKQYNEADILHLKGFTLDGLIGLSPITYAGETMGSLLEANRAAAHEFKNRLKVGGFLEYDRGVLQPEQREQFRRMLRHHQDPETAGSYMVLEQGVKVSPHNLRLNPADAQLLESRMFGVEEICRAFGVPPQLIGHTDKASSWASSLENTNMGFLTYSLRPTLVRIEQAVVRKLIKPADRGMYFPKFAVEGLLRTDTTARAGFYTQMLQNGVMSRNEVRGLEDLPPVDGGDGLTVQLNMTTLDKLGRENGENNAN